MIAAFALAVGASPGAAAPPSFVHETLDNGFRVSILSDPSFTVVATRLAVDVGSAHEAEGETGFAHLFEHLFSGGETQQVDERAWSRLHRIAGGYTNAFTGFDQTVYVSDIPADAHPEVLAFIDGWFDGMVFTPEALETEKRIVAEELRLRTENDPFDRAFAAAQRELLAGHPYGHEIAGTHEDIEAATVELCRKFYDRHYTADRLHLVIVGPVDAQGLLADVRSRFGDLPKSTTPLPDVPWLHEWTFPEAFSVSEDLPPARTLALLYPLPHRAHPDHWALKVLQVMLNDGQVDPFEDVLVGQMGKGLEAGNYSLTFRAGGVAVFYSAHLLYRSAKRGHALMHEAMAQMSDADWRSEIRLEAAKRRMLRQQLAVRWSPSSLATRIISAEADFSDAAIGLDHATPLAEVTLADIERVWRTWYAEATPIEVEMRPNRIPLAARLFGWTVPLFGGV
ncbi:MAG: pitrilysin family protein [Myxococcota bacterium]